MKDKIENKRNNKQLNILAVIRSVSFGVIKNRKEKLRKAQQELDDYIKNSKQK